MKIPTECKVVQAGKQWPWCVVASAVSRLHTVSIILIIITVLPLELQTKVLDDCAKFYNHEEGLYYLPIIYDLCIGVPMPI